MVYKKLKAKKHDPDRLEYIRPGAGNLNPYRYIYVGKISFNDNTLSFFQLLAKKRYMRALNMTHLFSKWGEGTYRLQLNWIKSKGFRHLWIGYVRKLKTRTGKIHRIKEEVTARVDNKAIEQPLTVKEVFEGVA